jgi:opacity protein-like surface antigen
MLSPTLASRRAPGLILIGAGLAALLAPAAARAQVYTINVNAFIDGKDTLDIGRNTVQWRHYFYDFPGQNGGHNDPTVITTTVDGVTVDSINWYPVWNGLVSDVLTLSVSLPPTSNVTFSPVRARESLTLDSAPSASNGYTAVVDFSDLGNGGADYYDALLTYTVTPVPEPGTMALVLGAASGVTLLRRRRRSV